MACDARASGWIVIDRTLHGHMQDLGLLVTFVLWDAASLSNTSGEYGLFGSLPRLCSYIDNVLTPMVTALAGEPVCVHQRPLL